MPRGFVWVLAVLVKLVEGSGLGMSRRWRGFPAYFAGFFSAIARQLARLQIDRLDVVCSV